MRVDFFYLFDIVWMNVFVDIFYMYDCFRWGGPSFDCLGFWGEDWSAAGWLRPPMILLLAVPGRLYCFGSLVILDVVCRYLSLFLYKIDVKC